MQFLKATACPPPPPTHPGLVGKSKVAQTVSTDISGGLVWLVCQAAFLSAARRWDPLAKLGEIGWSKSPTPVNLSHKEINLSGTNQLFRKNQLIPREPISWSEKIS